MPTRQATVDPEATPAAPGSCSSGLSRLSPATSMRRCRATVDRKREVLGPLLLARGHEPGLPGASGQSREDRPCEPGGMSRRAILGLLLGLSMVALAQDGEWVPVTGAERLRDFMSGLKAERTVLRGTVNRADYDADGTGTLFAWGAAIPRTWSVEGDDRICVTEERVMVRQ